MPWLSSIAGTISWGFLMRWVSQEEEGLMRVDRRVGFGARVVDRESLAA